MALFSGSPGSPRRPLGPRPFSGRESSAQAPALRPHGDPRRATAAPFQAIPDFLASNASVSLATPSEVPVTDVIDVQATAEHAAPQEAPTQLPVMAPSVLRVDDIRSEPFGWDRPSSEPALEPDPTPAAALEAPEALAEPVPEAAMEAPEAVPAIGEAVTDVLSVDVPGIEALTHEDPPDDDWFANEVMHAGSDPEASAWIEDDGAFIDVPVHSPWTDLAETVEAPTLETEAIDATEVQQSEAEAIEDALVAWTHDEDAVVGEVVEVAEVAEIVEVAEVAEVVDVAQIVEAEEAEEVVEAEVAEVRVGVAPDTDVPDVAPVPEAITSDAPMADETVPDESWWPAPVGNVASVAPEPEAAATPAPRRTPPVDGLAALEALVHETQGAERAVEALEAVARMIRSREIVVSVGAGATAESVLASILASLLSHPS